MPSLQLAAQALPFGTALTAIQARLGTINPIFPLPCPDFVRVVSVPDEKIPEYVAQAGILVRVRGPEPVSNWGAGRYGLQCFRNFDTVLLTEDLTDAAGTSENAVRAHMLLEESVANVLTLDVGPYGSYNYPVGLTVHWIPGPDEDITRFIPSDIGMIYSSLSFRAMYVAPLQVYRD